MNKAGLLIKAKLISAKHRFGIGLERKSRLTFKKAMVTLVCLGFLALLYFMFYRILNYLIGVPLLGPILVFKLISMIFLTFWLMLIYSNVITAFSTFYFSSDLPFLLSSPFAFNDIFTVKYAETTIYSSWTVITAFVPFFLAFGIVYSVNILFYPLVIAAMVPFIMTASGIGVIISLLLMSAFPTKRTRDLSLVAGVVLGGGVYVLFRFLQPEKLLNPEAMGSVLNYLNEMQAPTSSFLPNYWITNIMVSASKNQFLMYFEYFFMLVAVAAVFLAINLLLARSLYYSAWARVQGDSSKRKEGKWGNWGFFKNRLQRAMLEKDIRLFLRDTSQWSQLFLLGALMIVYIFNIYKLPEQAYKVGNITSFLNIGMVGFVLAALALRFVFPSISLEGRAYWVIRSSPLPPGKLILMKFRMVLMPLVFIGVALVLISNYLLGVDRFIMYLSLITIIVMAVGLTSINIGLGAMFPNFNVENITQIESSKGGLMCMIISLAYVGIIIMISALPVRMFMMKKFGYSSAMNYPGIIIPAVIFVVVNAIAIILPLYLGGKSLREDA